MSRDRQSRRSADRGRRSGRWILALLVLLAGVYPWVAQAEAPTEAQMQAIFVFRFTQFVEWPAQAFAGPTDPLVIVILGDDPILPELERVVAGERVNGRTLVVRRARSVDELRGGHAVVIGRSEAPRLAPILEALTTPGALTISAVDGFARRGGMIGFYVESDRVRFEIDPARAARARLAIHSRLLNLARIVDGNGGP